MRLVILILLAVYSSLAFSGKATLNADGLMDKALELRLEHPEQAKAILAQLNGYREKMTDDQQARWILLKSQNVGFLGDLDEAIRLIRSLLDSELDISDERKLRAYDLMAQAYLIKGDIELSFHYAIEGLKIYNHVSNPRVKYQINELLAFSFSVVNDKKHAQYYADKALSIAHEMNDVTMICRAYDALATYYEGTGELDKVQELIDKLRKKCGSSKFYSYRSRLFHIDALTKTSPKAALPKLNAFYQSKKDIITLYDKSYVIFLKAKVYYKLKHYAKAKETLLAYKKLADKINNNEMINGYYQLRTHIENKLGNVEKALYFANKRSDLLEERNRIAITILDSFEEYKNLVNDRETQLLKLKARNKELELKGQLSQQRVWLFWLTILFFTVVCALFIILLNKYRIRRGQ